MKKRTFGEALGQIRVSRGLTQDKMAHAVGVSIRFYQSLERGEKEPSVETLQKALDGLGMSYDDFFLISPPRPNPHMMKLLIEASADSVPALGLVQVMTFLALQAPEVRAATLAVLYGDKMIAAPYARKSGKSQDLK